MKIEIKVSGGISEASRNDLLVCSFKCQILLGKYFHKRDFSRASLTPLFFLPRDPILKCVRTIKSDIKEPRRTALFRASAAGYIAIASFVYGAEFRVLSPERQRTTSSASLSPTLKSQSRLIAQDETESISRSTRLRRLSAGLNAKSPSVDIPIEAEEY